MYKDFIQYNHDKYFAADPQISQLAYTKPQKECLHWINRSNHHFTSYFYDVDLSYEAEFNEKDIVQASK